MTFYISSYDLGYDIRGSPHDCEYGMMGRQDLRRKRMLYLLLGSMDYGILNVLNKIDMRGR